MNFYTKEQIDSKYSSKKSSCNKRKIKFEFTKEEFVLFCNYLDEDSKCAYTGVQLVKDNGHKNQASIERIDSTKGYSINNCIWVTKESNQLKGRFDERNKQLKAAFTKQELKILEDILKCDVADKLDSINKFIKEGKYEVTGETKQQNEKLNAKDMNENSNEHSKYSVVNVNTDVELAKKYFEFAEHSKDYVDFLLSFNEYKKLMSKKQCQLSMQKFDEEHKPSLFVLDKTQPVTYSNLIVVDLLLRHNLDTFIGKSKLNNKQMKTVFTNISKLV